MKARTILFHKDDTCFPGVVKIAEKVKKDLTLATDLTLMPDDFKGECDIRIIYGTIGRSVLLDEYERRGEISLEKIRNKNEVYGFFVSEGRIIIAGSDKRGTIYGLFHLSELLGVSPLVNWNHVMPEKKAFSISGKDTFISKEPSVKYRGFFINDEWPAFGNWATRHFGGINALCYERVFELLLRLKGNYLWPAMWNSNFNLDGPGLKSAELADEYGIVMSTSHHEPCMRAGEEFTLMKGGGSPYGRDWNFRTNREGITNFWRDGLIRNRTFENVITMGMRGERDSAILGKDATIKDNVELLRDVLKTQNRLIGETIGNPETVPRQMVLFTEVEEFFYGTEDTEGLNGSPELDGITLMLSDNNFGYTRTLPTRKMRNHKGGYGMYYHMDMHGGAYSYQWIGSTYLPVVWEQMTQAYEFGVKEIWVVNIGDIGTQELGLSFFLDLAYDMDRWGGQDAGVTLSYVTNWVNRHFAFGFDEADRKAIERLIWGMGSLLVRRKHEIMNSDVYHPLHFGEAEAVLREALFLEGEAERLKKLCCQEQLSAFISLIYYPVCGTANLMKMWIYAGRNKLYASQNRMEANTLIPLIENCVKEDQRLIKEYESVDDGYYDGFGDSPHIGFVNWNDEDCKYPVRHMIYPAREPRMLVTRPDREAYSTGLYWCDKKQKWEDFLRNDISEIDFCLVNGSDKAYFYKIENDNPCLKFSAQSGTVILREDIRLTVNKQKIKRQETMFFLVRAYADHSCREQLAVAKIEVAVKPVEEYSYTPGTFVEHEGYISFPADAFIDHYSTEKGSFKQLKPYGREGSAIKVYPSDADFLEDSNPPFTEYSVAAEGDGQYNLRFYLAPTTPVVFERIQYLGYSVNHGEIIRVNTVKKPEKPFFLSEQWEQEAKDNIKLVEQKVFLKKGENRIRFYAMSPGMVLENIVLWPVGTNLPGSYLTPKVSYRV